MRGVLFSTEKWGARFWSLGSATPSWATAVACPLLAKRNFLLVLFSTEKYAVFLDKNRRELKSKPTAVYFHISSIFIRFVFPDWPFVTPPVMTSLSPDLRFICRFASFFAV